MFQLLPGVRGRLDGTRDWVTCSTRTRAQSQPSIPLSFTAFTEMTVPTGRPSSVTSARDTSITVRRGSSSGPKATR